MAEPAGKPVPVFGESPYVDTRVLVIVKTYPNPSQKYLETVCTAGITDDGRLIRMYPIPFRRLADDKQFKKYQWMRIRLRRSTSDRRPESYQIDETSIRPEDQIGTSAGWRERRSLILPFRSDSMEALWAEQEENGRSLGLIRPATVRRFRIVPSGDPDWTPGELARLGRWSLFADAPRFLLEKIPWEFHYEFTCADPNCKGHDMQVFDWELLQSYRSWHAKHPSDWKAKLEQTYRDRFVNRTDLHFFVGTIAEHPKAWTIIGLFYPLPSDEAAPQQRANGALEVVRRPRPAARERLGDEGTMTQPSLFLETE